MKNELLLLVILVAGLGCDSTVTLKDETSASKKSDALVTSSVTDANTVATVVPETKETSTSSFPKEPEEKYPLQFSTKPDIAVYIVENVPLADVSKIAFGFGSIYNFGRTYDELYMVYQKGQGFSQGCKISIRINDSDPATPNNYLMKISNITQATNATFQVLSAFGVNSGLYTIPAVIGPADRSQWVYRASDPCQDLDGTWMLTVRPVKDWGTAAHLMKKL